MCCLLNMQFRNRHSTCCCTLCKEVLKKLEYREIIFLVTYFKKGHVHIFLIHYISSKTFKTFFFYFDD